MCVHTSIYGFSVAERNEQPLLTFPLFLNKALAKVTEKPISPTHYYKFLFTALLPESAVFRVAPFIYFFSPLSRKNENPREHKRRREMDGHGSPRPQSTARHRRSLQHGFASLPRALLLSAWEGGGKRHQI